MAKSARSIAAAAGEKIYDSGRVCKNGHGSKRYTINGRCIVCIKDYWRARYEETKHMRIADQRARYAKIQADPRLKEAYIAARRPLNRSYKNIPEPTRPEPNACEICGGPPNGRIKRLQNDHCHEIGIFRGWLCWDCNVGLGKLGDNIEGIEKALQYLKRAYGKQ